MTRQEKETLKKLIREFVEAYDVKGGSYPDEAYDKELLDDPAYEAGSVYVPKDIKKKINKWAQDMGLSTTKK